MGKLGTLLVLTWGPLQLTKSGGRKPARISAHVTLFVNPSRAMTHTCMWWPCRECVRLVKELGLPVEYIVLPTFAYEHKIFVGPFSRAFREAQVWVAPRYAS